MLVKSRKQEGCLVLPIPSYLNIPEGAEYEVSLSEKGELIFSPVENIQGEFVTNDELSVITEDIFKEYDEVFRELVDK